jgi:hypothetical protein
MGVVVFGSMLLQVAERILGSNALDLWLRERMEAPLSRRELAILAPTLPQHNHLLSTW